MTGRRIPPDTQADLLRGRDEKYADHLWFEPGTSSKTTTNSATSTMTTYSEMGQTKDCFASNALIREMDRERAC